MSTTPKQHRDKLRHALAQLLTLHPRLAQVGVWEAMLLCAMPFNNGAVSAMRFGVTEQALERALNRLWRQGLTVKHYDRRQTRGVPDTFRLTAAGEALFHFAHGTKPASAETNEAPTPT